MVFSDSPVSTTNKTDRHDITEILLKVALNTIKQTKKSIKTIFCGFEENMYFHGHINSWILFYSQHT